MGSLFRSEEMCLSQLFLQTEAAYACVAELGELGLIQFRDLNPDVSAFQRKFVNEVRRCDEMERKLRFLEKEIRRDAIPMLDTGENPDAPQPREMVDLEATFEKLENELREVNTNEEMLKKNYLELTELKHILRKTQTFFDETTFFEYSAAAQMHEGGGTGGPRADDREALLAPGAFDDGTRGAPALKLGFVAGVILRERLPAFERLLWRACRGNVFLRQAEITEPLEDPTTGDNVNKSVFIIFFQGDQLKTRVKKICEGFRATLYPCPDTPQERREMAIGVMTRIEDLKTVLGQTQDHRHRVLVAASKNVRMWFTKVHKLKAIYHTLNLFNLDVTQKCLIAECWCPMADLDKIQLALKRGTEESGSNVPSILNRMQTDEQRPTYHRGNKFTQGFQNIVDAYGMASYQEINPAPFTVISFPFLFGVMFGDFGHGLIMFLAALFFVLKEKQLIARRIRDETFHIFFGGRYVILLMGLFAMYCGVVYNDVYARSFNLFASGWKNPYSGDYLDRIAPPPPAVGSSAERVVLLETNPAYAYQGDPYPFGIDPVWNLAENKLNFLNSFKMKMSVIIGIGQMTFGVILSYLNYRHFNRPLDVYCQFVPQMIFLASIFIYLCLMIIYKWLTFGVAPASMSVGCYPGSHCAPSLLIGLINMFMFKSVDVGFVNNDNFTCAAGQVPPGVDRPLCYLNAYYPGQMLVQSLLVVVALVCVPVMLFVKPIVLRARHRRQARYALSVRADMDADGAQVLQHEAARPAGGGGGGHGQGEPFDLMDVSVHQAIHTIEFCLGCVSHTASYLRLWALSLAHAQLSEVLWDMVLRQGFSMTPSWGGVAVYVLFAFFAILTFGILIFMEGLSAFLHALRLHWVEFQNKFYVGEGYAFAPFSFDSILQEARSADE